MRIGTSLFIHLECFDTLGLMSQQLSTIHQL